MKGKKFRLFAGPNGSGKSTLIEEIQKEVNIGYFINADVIERKLRIQKAIDLLEFVPVRLLQKQWIDFLKRNSEDSRIKNRPFDDIELIDNFLVCRQGINSYHAAVIAEFFREVLLKSNKTFSFETVMSHDSKISFLDLAKQHGFTTYLYFICTRDVNINIERVKNRVQLGGHNVSEEKMKNRFFSSLSLLKDAFEKADRVFIIDSTSQKRSLVLEKKAQNIIFHSETIPEWVDEYLLKKLSLI